MEIKSKNKRLYWLAKGFISFFMLFSAYYVFTHGQDLRALGFPDYFRIELSIAKVLGAVTLLLPQTPERIKEWIYAGFGITMISALIAHIACNDPISKVIFLCVDIVLVFTSIQYVHNTEQTQTKTA